MSPQEATPTSKFTGIQHGVRGLAVETDLWEWSLCMQLLYTYALKNRFHVEKPIKRLIKLFLWNLIYVILGPP